MTIRSLHAWASVLLAVPMFLIAVTAILLAHENEWGLKDTTIDVTWLPAYSETQMRMEQHAPRSLLNLSDGSTVLGTKSGIYRVVGETLQPIGGPTTDVRGLLEDRGTLYAATKSGFLRHEPVEDRWIELARGDFHGVGRNGDTVVAVDKHGRFYAADAAQARAEPVALFERPLAALPVESVGEVTLAKLVKDIHTGKAFVGKTWEWAFIDLMGLILALLSLTGVWMWLRARRRQAQVAQQQATAQLDRARRAPQQAAHAAGASLAS